MVRVVLCCDEPQTANGARPSLPVVVLLVAGGKRRSRDSQLHLISDLPPQKRPATSGECVGCFVVVGVVLSLDGRQLVSEPIVGFFFSSNLLRPPRMLLGQLAAAFSWCLAGRPFWPTPASTPSLFCGGRGDRILGEWGAPAAALLRRCGGSTGVGSAGVGGRRAPPRRQQQLTRRRSRHARRPAVRQKRKRQATNKVSSSKISF